MACVASPDLLFSLLGPGLCVPNTWAFLQLLWCALLHLTIVCLHMLSPPLSPMSFSSSSLSAAGLVNAYFFFSFSVQAHYHSSQSTMGISFIILISIITLHLSVSLYEIFFSWLEIWATWLWRLCFFYHWLHSDLHSATRHWMNVCIFGKLLNE